jgi:hypothetical protein
MKHRVYFAAAAGRIKIGTTVKEVGERITAINSHLVDRLKIIGFIDGGSPLERAIHKHLSRWRLNGEWFKDCEAVRMVIDRLLADGAEAIGYEGEIFPERKQQNSTPGDSVSLGRLARLIWPNDAVMQLRAFTGADENDVAGWLDGSIDPPRLVRYAFATVVMRFTAGGAENFVAESLAGAEG